MSNRFDRSSYTSRKDQTNKALNELFDERDNEKFQKRFYSGDGRFVLYVGAQPNGDFGVAVYENNGDFPDKITEGASGLLQLPGSQNIEGDDYVSVTNNNGEYQIVLQDTVRIAALNSAYPIGSIYQNDTDSRAPSVLMNWNSSSWQKIDDAVRITKDMTDPDSDPEYISIFCWKRTS